MKHRRIYITAIVAAGTVLLCFFALLMYMRSAGFSEQAARIVSEKATQTLETRIELGSVKIDDNKDIVINDAAIYDKQDKIVAKIPEAVVKLSYMAAIKGASAGSVSEVSVKNPEVWLSERDDGSWNVQDLLKESSEESGFRGKVRLSGGTVTASMRGQTLKLRQVEGTVDMADSPSADIDVDCMSMYSPIHAEGTVSSDVQDVKVTIDDVGIEDYMKYLTLLPPLPEGIDIKSGTIDHAEAYIRHDGDGLALKGRAAFHDGAVTAMGVDIAKLQGQANFDQSSAMLFIHAEAAGEPAAIHGRIRWDEESPRLALVAESEGFDPSKVMVDLPFAGKVSFRASVGGTLDAPVIRGKFETAEAVAYGIPLQDARVDLTYDGMDADLRHFEADILGGHAEGEGRLHMDDLSYDLHVKAAGIDIAGLSDLVGQDMAGTADGDIALNGVGTDTAGISVYGSASIKDGRLKGAEFTRADASFFVSDGMTVIDAANVLFPGGGEIGATGSIRNADEIALDFYGAHISLRNLANAFPDYIDADGIADIDGSVHGSLSNPMVEVDLSAVDGHLFKQPFELLRTSVSGSLDGIGVDYFQLENNGKNTWYVKGSVGFTRDKKIDLQIDTVGARMEDIAALVAPDQPITGNVDNIIKITGTLDNPSAVGYVHFYRGSYRGYLLSGMDGDYTYKDKVVTVQDFHIFSPIVDMDLNGTIDPKYDINMKVEAHDIDLKRMASRLPYPVEGHAKFSGLIAGNVSAPVFDGKLTGDKLTLNGQDIADVRGDVHYRDHIVSVEGFTFHQNDGIFGMDMKAGLNDKSLSGKIDITNGDVQAIAAFADLKNDIFTGRLSGTLDIAGTMDNPKAHLEAVVPDGKLREYSLTDVAVDADYEDGVLTLSEFSGHQDDGFFIASGVMDSNRDIDAEANIENAPLGLIAACAGSSAKVSGTVNAQAKISGNLSSPRAVVTLQAKNGGVGTATFDSLTGDLNLDHGVLEVHELRMEKQGKDKVYSLSAAGTAPLKAIMAKDNNIGSAYDQFNLTVNLENADLGLLPALSRQVDWAMGPLTGKLNVTGTLARPLVNGEVKLSGGAMKLKLLKDPIKDMEFDIKAAGDRLNIEKGSLRMGGGKAELTGSTLFTGNGFSGYDIRLKADKLGVNSTVYKGPLDGELRLSEGVIGKGKPWEKTLPELSGHLDISDVTISVPSLPSGDSDLPDIILDFDVNLGKKVHLYSASLYDMWFSGGVHFGGTTKHPKTSGTVKVQRGSITYNNTIFRVSEGEAYFNQVDSFLPSIHFVSSARVNRVKISLTVDGPLEHMDFKLSSSPSMSQTEIIRLLTFHNSSMDTLDSELNAQDLVSFGLRMSVLSELENSMRDLLNLDQFTISGEAGHLSTDNKGGSRQSQDVVYSVEMGKYIGDKVMVNYKQAFNDDEYRVGMMYEFNDRYSLMAGRDTEKGFMTGILAKIRF